MSVSVSQTHPRGTQYSRSRHVWMREASRACRHTLTAASQDPEARIKAAPSSPPDEDPRPSCNDKQLTPSWKVHMTESIRHDKGCSLGYKGISTAVASLRQAAPHQSLSRLTSAIKTAPGHRYELSMWQSLTLVSSIRYERLALAGHQRALSQGALATYQYIQEMQPESSTTAKTGYCCSPHQGVVG